MGWVKRVLRRLRAVARVEVLDCEIKAELLFHIEMRTQGNIDAGMPPEQAREDAIRRFGDFERISECCRQVKKGQRAAPLEKAVTLCTWLLAAAGLAISLYFMAAPVRQVGHLLIAIAVLLRLFIYARKAATQRRPTLLESQRRLFMRDDI